MSTASGKNDGFPWWLKTKWGYAAYLESPEWAAFRERYFEKHERSCFVCGETFGIQLHHLSYRHVGRERFTDVIQLCDAHHKMTHRLIREKKAPLHKAHLIVKRDSND